MSNQNSDSRSSGKKGGRSADRKKVNNSKNYNNGRRPFKPQPQKIKNSFEKNVSDRRNTNFHENDSNPLKNKKKNKPVKSEENYNLRLDSENDEVYEPVSRTDMDVEASDILDRENRKNLTDKDYKKLLSPAKKPMSETRRKLRRVLFYAATIMILAVLCFVLSLTVFFKIDDIRVEGKTRYDSSDIIAACAIETGDNLFLCNTSIGEKQIVEQFPYIESVEIKKELFNKIVINVKEASPMANVEHNGKYIVLSQTHKIIEIDKEKKYDVPTIIGAGLKNVHLSSTIEFKDKNVKNYIAEIIKALKDYKITPIETIDVSNLSNITIVRKNGFRIFIGTPENISYKIKTAKEIIRTNIKDDDIGTLDVSLASPDGGKSYWKSESKPESSKVKKTETSKSSKTESSSENSQENSTADSEEESPNNEGDSGDTDEDGDSGEDTYDDTVYDDDTYTDDGDDTYTDDGYDGDDAYTDDGYDDDIDTDEGGDVYEEYDTDDAADETYEDTEVYEEYEAYEEE